MTATLRTNGQVRKNLACPRDRLDGILNGLADGLNDAQSLWSMDASQSALRPPAGCKDGASSAETCAGRTKQGYHPCHSRLVGCFVYAAPLCFGRTSRTLVRRVISNTS